MPDFRSPTARDRFMADIRLGLRAGVAGDGNAGKRAIGAIELLGSVRGLAGVTAYESDLPFGAAPEDRETVVELERAFKRAKLRLTAYGLAMHERSAVFRAGSFTSHDPEVRAYALQVTMLAMDRGSALGAKLFVLDLSTDRSVAIAFDDLPGREKRLREAFNFLARYNLDRGYGLRLVLRVAPLAGTEPVSRASAVRTHAPSALGGLANARLFHASLKQPDQFAISAAVHADDDPAAITSAADAGALAQVDIAGLRTLDPLTALGVARALEQNTFSGDRTMSPLSAEASTTDAEGIVTGIQSTMHDYLRWRDRMKAWESDAEVKALRRQIERHSPDLERLCASFSKAKAETLLGMSLEASEPGTHAAPFDALRHRTLQIIYGND